MASSVNRSSPDEPDQPQTPQASTSTSSLPLRDSEVETASIETIRDAIRKGPNVAYKEGGFVRISEHAAVKFGPYRYLYEANNMEFVAKHTSIRVPRVIRTFQVLGQVRKWLVTYIVMEYVDCNSLAECWDSLTETRRENICEQVARAVAELQTLQVDRPGPIGGGTPEGFWFKDIGFSFESTTEFETWYSNVLTACKMCKKVDPDEPPFKFGKMVMSHMDLAPRNIMLEDGDKICLVDWGRAGAYPEHFERAALMKQRHDPEFTERLLAKLPRHERAIEELRRIEWAMISSAGLREVPKDITWPEKVYRQTQDTSSVPSSS